MQKDPRQRPGQEPTKQVLDWQKIAIFAFVPVVVVLLILSPYFARWWTIQGAYAEAERIKIIGDVLETPEGALYIQYLEGKNDD